jgi:hypothetical protein
MSSNMLLVTAARQLPQLQLQLENLRKSEAEALVLIERYTRLTEEAEETLSAAKAKMTAAQERVEMVELLFTTYQTTAEEVLIAFGTTQPAAVLGRAVDPTYHETPCRVCLGPCARGTEGGAAYVVLPEVGRVLVCSEACVTQLLAPKKAAPKPQQKKAPPVVDQTPKLCERCRTENASTTSIRRAFRGRFCQQCVNAGDNFLSRNEMSRDLTLKYLVAVPSSKAPGVRRGTVTRAGREFRARHPFDAGAAPVVPKEVPKPAAPAVSAPAPVSMEDLVTAAEMWRDGASIEGIADCLGLDPEQLGKVLAGMSKPPKAAAPEPVEPEPKKRKSTPLRLTEAELGPLLLAVLNGSDAAWPSAKLANELAKGADTHDRRFTGRRLISDITRYLDACADRGGVVRNENVAGKGVTYRRKYNPLRNQ